jgi:hypothetical protein
MATAWMSGVEYSDIDIETKQVVCRAVRHPRERLLRMIGPWIARAFSTPLHDSGVAIHTARRCGDTSWRDTT